MARTWDEVGSHEREKREKETAITSQEDQDGESRVFAVQAIYLAMTNTSIESEITDISHVTYNESHVIHYESGSRVRDRVMPHVAYYESADTRS